MRNLRSATRTNEIDLNNVIIIIFDAFDEQFKDFF